MKKAPSLKSGCTHFMRDTWNEGKCYFQNCVIMVNELDYLQSLFNHCICKHCNC